MNPADAEISRRFRLERQAIDLMIAGRYFAAVELLRPLNEGTAAMPNDIRPTATCATGETATDTTWHPSDPTASNATHLAEIEGLLSDVEWHADNLQPELRQPDRSMIHLYTAAILRILTATTTN